MQLPSQNDGALVVGEQLHESVSGLSGGSDAPASPSSPSSPTKNGTTREKPVKVLPCPRCESMNTKFCYYNNYSVTQPRHFCRQCQRYWTAGGTLRNVPVGGGSRKKSRHQRSGAAEPYLQRSGPFGVANSADQNAGFQQNVGFQQMLTQDMVGLNFAQLPGFGPNPHHFVPFSLEHSQGLYPMMNNKQEELPSTHAMYGNAPMSAPMGGGYYPPSGGENLAGVKPEFWAPGSNPNQRLDSSMLLNLGLNNRPPPQVSGNGNGKPAWDHQSMDVKPVNPGPGPLQQKNGSPPHGSSTIEEEGSTPTNGYSNSGYEEGDAVSSMWHEYQDMESIMFQ